jgi:two-component system LytT family response regulator
MKIRAVIVDDEPLARTRIRSLLKADPGIEVAGEAGSGPEAVAAIQSLSPDLVFLDIQMPEMDGFEVIRRIGPEKMPVLIFTTAYDQYALRAFDVHAQDYLLKPIIRERFRRALARAVEHIQTVRIGGRIHAGLTELLKDARAGTEMPTRLLVKSGEKSKLIKIEEIDWVEAAEKYVLLHCGPARHILRGGITEMEHRLDARRFLRVHRSAIVNLDSIGEIQPWFQGRAVLLLKNGEKVTVSRTFREKLERVFRR